MTPPFRLIVLLSLNNDPLVSHTARNALLIKVFKKWNGVFAGYADEVLKGPNVNFGRLGFLRGHEFAQALEGRVVKNKIVCQLDQDSVTEQERYELLRPRFIDGKFVEHFLHQRDFQACVGEGLFNLLLGFGFFVFEFHATAGQPDLFSGDLGLFVARELSQYRFHHRLMKSQLLTQLFFADAADQRISFVKSFQRGDEFVPRFLHSIAGE